MFKVLQNRRTRPAGANLPAPHGTVQTPVFMNVGAQAAIVGEAWGA